MLEILLDIPDWQCASAISRVDFWGSLELTSRKIQFKLFVWSKLFSLLSSRLKKKVFCQVFCISVNQKYFAGIIVLSLYFICENRWKKGFCQDLFPSVVILYSATRGWHAPLPHELGFASCPNCLSARPSAFSPPPNIQLLCTFVTKCKQTTYWNK